jgi:hypothetical protein
VCITILPINVAEQRSATCRRHPGWWWSARESKLVATPRRMSNKQCLGRQKQWDPPVSQTKVTGSHITPLFRAQVLLQCRWSYRHERRGRKRFRPWPSVAAWIFLEQKHWLRGERGRAVRAITVRHRTPLLPPHDTWRDSMNPGQPPCPNNPRHELGLGL